MIGSGRRREGGQSEDDSSQPHTFGGRGLRIATRILIALLAPLLLFLPATPAWAGAGTATVTAQDANSTLITGATISCPTPGTNSGSCGTVVDNNNGTYTVSINFSGSSGTDITIQAAKSNHTTSTGLCSITTQNGTCAVTITMPTLGPSNATFSAGRLKASADSTWTVGFTTTSQGALSQSANDNQIVVTFPTGFTFRSPFPTTGIGLTSGFSNCSTTTSTSSTAITITLHNNAGTCAVNNSTAVTFTIPGVINTSTAGAITNTNFKVHTSADQTDQNPASGVTITSATQVTIQTFTASATGAASKTAYTIGFTTSSTGSLAAGDDITAAFNTHVSVSATPTASLVSGFSNCSVSVTSGTSTAVQLTLADSGGTCGLGNSTAATLKIIGITNGTAGSTANITLNTASDATGVAPATGVSLLKAVSAVSFSGSRTTAGSIAAWTEQFTTSNSGALATGSTITIAFDSSFSIPASPTVTLVSGFSLCGVSSASTSGSTVTITLTNSGGTCALNNSTTAQVKIAGITNPAAATYSQTQFTVKTSADTGSFANSSDITITAAGSVTSVSFSATSLTISTSTTYTANFTTTSSGSLAAGDTITVTFPSGYSVASNPTISITAPSGSHCSGTSPGNSTTVTITLANSGGTCAIGNSTATTLTIASVTNPSSAGSKSINVHTAADSTDVSGSVTIISAPTSVTFTGNHTQAGARATWTEQFTVSSSGALAAGGTITVTFDSSFTIPATPTVTLAGSFTNCSAAGAASSNVVTITLSNNGGTCALANSATGSVAIQGITNPAAATYTSTNFKVHTSADTTDAIPASNVTISAATSVTSVSFSGSTQAGGTSATWTVGFTTSSSGNLATGDSITVVFDPSFTVLVSPTVTLPTGFSSCSVGSASGSGTTVTITLSGASCSLATSTAATLTIAGVGNPAAGTYNASGFTVKTSVDTTAVADGANEVITASSPTSVTFSGSPQTGGARSTWTVGFTTSTVGALAATNTITIVFNSGFTVPASPTVALTGGFVNCSASASGSGTTVTVTLSNNGGTCALANSTAATLTLKFLTNPAAATLTGTTFSVATTADTAAASPSNVTISAATSPTSVTFSGSPQTGGARSTWTVGYTTSASGAMVAGDTVTIHFDSGFTVPASPTVVLGSGYTNCSASASGSGTTVTVTLSDNGGSCSVGNTAATSLTLAFLTNPAAGSLTNTNFTVKTSRDTATASPASNVTINTATSVTSVSFAGASQVGGDSSTWTVGFTTSGSGALSAGDTITVVFNSSFSISSATPAIGLPSGFSNCSATGSRSSTTVTITLADNGGTCSLANSTAGTLTVAGVHNPAAGTYNANTFTVATSRDTATANDAAAETITASSVSSVTFSGSPQTDGARSTWTVGFTTSSVGALAANDTVTVVFNPGFTVPASPTVALTGGFVNCSASASATGTTVTVTLSNNGGTCALANSTAATLTLRFLTNPGAVTLNGSTFSVATSKDTNPSSPSNVQIAAATSVSSVTFSGSPQTGSARSTWTVGYTTTASGAMVAGDTIAIHFNSDFTVPASPTVVLGSGYTNCSASASGSGTTVTVTLSDNGGSCSVGNSTATSLTLATLTNPAAGALTNTTFTVATSRDTSPASPASNVTINAATSVSSVDFSGASQVGGDTTTWTVGFTTSSTGAMVAGDQITVVFNSNFSIGSATPTITLPSGFTNCSATGARSGSTVTVTLADDGGTCSLDNSTAGSLTVAGVHNPAAGTYNASTFTVVTTRDTVATADAANEVITASSPSSVTFSGNPQTGGARSVWTVGFTTSSVGALAAGDTITVVFNSGFTVPASPTVALTSGFVNCSASASATGTTVTVTLADNGGTCALDASTAATLTLKFLNNPAVATLNASTFSVATSEDTNAASPASDVVISAATSPSSVTFSGSPQTGAARATWTVGYTTSSSGWMAAGDTITIHFNSGFTVPASPTVALGSGYSSCSATASGSGTTVTVTLSGVSCSVGNSAATSLTLKFLTNPAAGTLTGSTFTVKTSRDTAPASPSDVTIDPATSVSSVSFAGTSQVGGDTTTWTVGFTTSSSGAMEAGDQVIVAFDSNFSINSATPTITLPSGFTNCSATGSALGATVTVTLADDGGTCSLDNSTAGSLTVAGVHNPAAGTYSASGFTVATTRDTAAAADGANEIITASSTSSVTFSGSPQTGGALSTWTVGFTTSSVGALADGDTITVVFDPSFTLPASPTITLPSGFTNCSASASASGTTVTITLHDDGGTCMLDDSTSGTLTIAGITNPDAGTYDKANFSVATSEDTNATSPASDVVISAATSPSSVTFSGSPQTGGARSTWTVGYTTSSTGAMAAGDTITIHFNSGFTVPASPTVALGSGYSSCSASASATGTTVTVTMSGVSCSVANSAATSLTLKVLTNPAAATLTGSTFTVKTSRDTATASPSDVVIDPATSVSSVSFAGTSQVGGEATMWTVGFTTSSSGALSAGDQVTVVFNNNFSINSATPTITLPSGFVHCSATGSRSSTTVTITLADNGGTCSLANSTAGSLTVGGVVNPAQGTYNASTFTVVTTRDTSAAADGANEVITGPAPSNVTFSGSPQTADARSTWTVGFTSSTVGALADGATITVVFDSSFTVPASPTVTLPSGFTNCSATASASGTTVTITLHDDGGTCSLPNSTAATVTVAVLTNPDAGTIPGSNFSVTTSEDTNTASPASDVTIDPATSVTSVSFAGASQVGGDTTTWTVGFTTSSSGAMSAGDQITVAFDPAFSINSATPSIGLPSGFVHCSATGSRSGSTVTVTLADSGGTCSLDNSTAGSLTVAGVHNPAAGTYNSSGFTVATTRDTATANDSAAEVITDSSSSSAMFSGDPQTGGALSTWTVGFTTSSVGALADGDTITVVFDPGFSVTGSPNITLPSGFTNCSATASASGTTVTITLHDDGGTCSLDNSTAGTLTIADVTNPDAGTYDKANFSVATSEDGGATNPASDVVIDPATSVSSVSFAGDSQAAGHTTDWTVGFTTSSSGALSAGDSITVIFDSGFTVPASPTITLPSGFTNCSATASASGTTVTITLADDGGTCSLDNSTAGSVTIDGITNPSAGTYDKTNFSIATTKDTSATSPASDVVIALDTSPSSVTFSGADQHGGVTTDWTVGFTTSATGALADGNTITVVFDPAFTVPGSPTVTLPSGFTNCSATASASGTTVTITLHDDGGTCSLDNSTAGSLTIDGITNPAAGTYDKGNFTVHTDMDPVDGSPSSDITIDAASDGSGTMVSDTANVVYASTGNTITFTYTETADGGMNDGAVRIVVASGWNAPSTSSGDAGYTTSDAGTVGTSGQFITVSGLTLAKNDTVHIVYGASSGATAPSTAGPATWQAKQASTSGGTLTDLAASPSINVLSQDGSGTLTTPTTSVPATSTGNTIVFTYTATAGGMVKGTINLAVPTGWSAPSLNSAAAGYVTTSVGTLAISGRMIQVSNLTRTNGQTVVITYGAAPGPGATAPSTPVGPQTWQSQEKSSSGGTLTNLGSSPSISVTADDGKGTLTTPTASVRYGSSGNTITFTYTADTGGLSNGTVTIDVPTGWDVPSTTSSDNGYTTSTAGSVSITGIGLRTITVSGISKVGGQTVIITYGSTTGGGSGATAPSSAGPQTWQAQEKSSSGGSLTNLAASPSINVLSPDGSGTMTTPTTSVPAASIGNTIVFTYTAATGGMNKGQITLAVPIGWSAPSTTSSAAGYVTSNVGTLSLGGRTIYVSNLTRSGSQTVVITYGDTGGSGPGATAPSTPVGAQTWQAQEKSGAGGSLTNLGSSPSITVGAGDGKGTLTTPTTNVSYGSSGNTITFTYTADTGGLSNGTVTIDVPTGWDVPSTTSSDNGYTTSTAGSVSITGIGLRTITVSGITKNAGQTVYITYGNKIGGGTGATAPSSVGPQTWQAQEKSSSGGSLTNLAASPSINVLSPDGSGTMTTPTTSVPAASTGNTIQFTYTAAPGGMAKGVVSVIVPTGWSAPSLTSSAAGYATANIGTVTISGRYITVANLYLSNGQTVVITYGDKSGGGPGATAPAKAVGAQTWQALEKSAPGGTLTNLASSPSIMVVL